MRRISSFFLGGEADFQVYWLKYRPRGVIIGGNMIKRKEENRRGGSRGKQRGKKEEKQLRNPSLYSVQNIILNRIKSRQIISLLSLVAEYR